MNQHRGGKFEQLQRESYGQLCGDLDFALYKVQHPVRTHFEHNIVSLAVKEMDGVSEMSCLDIGCGQGVTTYVLNKHFDTVVGVDFSSGSIRTADEFLGAMDVSNASVLVGDVDSFGLKDCSVDIVRLKHSLCHTAEALRAMENPARVSRDEG